MDEQEILRQKYKILKTKLYNIRYNLNQLNSEYKNLDSKISRLILIDDKIFDEKNFKIIENNNDSILDELDSIVIPRVNNKSNN